MKKELFGDDEVVSSKKLLKLPDCPGVADAFSTDDFKKHVLKDEHAVIAGTNSEYLKNANRSKPVLAFQFNLAVDSGDLKWAMMDEVSKKRIKAIVGAIASRLI
ncbi:hypothetical protein [Thiobacillus denitrificans]|uniref:hypothetical protein n=1 Tax=Thiobacillus denitrificans TaxID=36861 RepID=UPI00037012B0|nr:hypothetical protein [Thiobacillus denitrificans]